MMKLTSTILSLFAALFFMIPDLSGQQVHKLNTIDSRSKQITGQTISGAEQLRQYYILNDDPSVYSDISVGDYIEMEVTPGESTTFVVNRVENYTPTTTSFITHDVNNRENTFTFTYSNGRLHGLFHKSHEQTYFFEYDNQLEQNYVSKSSSFYDDEESCSIHEIDHDISAISGFQSINKWEAASKISSYVPNTAAMAGSLTDEITIDVILLYTENAKTWADTSSSHPIDVVISQAMGLSQTALDKSEIHIKLRLVHYYQTDYNEDSPVKLNEGDSGYVSSGDHLRRLTRDDDNPFALCSGDETGDCQESDYNGYFSDAHDLRDEFGADVVAAILSEPNTGGIAWGNTSIIGSPYGAFSINRVQQIATSYTLIHEIGHNMGNAHARNQTTSKASDFGGMFVYSTGNRFSSSGNNFATVMAYDEDGYTSIGYFSNPDMELSGVPIGNPITSISDAGPSDNARSMREIKRVIAAYRPSVVDPPIIDVVESSITAELNQENRTVTVPITIQNNGLSDLMWDFDFDIQSGVIAASKKQSDKIMSSIPIPNTFATETSTSFSELNEPGTIYSTSFETDEGFSLGDFPAKVGWRSFSETAPFEISDENPSDGNHHLRLPRRSEVSGTSVYSRSPFFGPQPMSEFAISFDIAVQDLAIGGDVETFDVYSFDSSNGAISSALRIKGGNIKVLNVNEQGSEGFSFTNTSLPTNGSYRTIEIRFNPNNKTIDYYLEGTQIASNPYTSGRKPDFMHFFQENNVSGAYMDIDNIKVERLHSPFNWLSTQKFGGVLAPGESESVELTLNAIDVQTGNYESVLLVRSNDPNNPVIEVPISATIEMATTSEESQETPQRLQLSQNYPNPFNPTTNIQFVLNQPSDVTLEVFNITGQKVATLVHESLPAGSHQQTFDASGLSSGIYLYRLKTPEQMLTRQMILIK